MTDNNALNSPSGSVNVNSLAQQYINNNGYSMQSQPMQRQPQQQPVQPIRDSYRPPVQDGYRMWNDPQRVGPQMQPWPQVPAQSLSQLPTRDEMIQLQQQPDWPVRPILPVVIPSSDSKVATPPTSKPAVVLAAEAKKLVVKQPASLDSDEEGTDSDDESDRIDDSAKQVTEPPKKKPRTKHRKGDGKTGVHHDEDHRVKEQMRRIKSDMEMEFMDHDGAAERPGGAVLSLTLGKLPCIKCLAKQTIKMFLNPGLIVTVALVILVGCRATVVRRRVRGRGGKGPYAHDADFLVNGMYL